MLRDGQVLVLLRPGRDQVRLPKGHVEPGEEPSRTALREVSEETGYHDVSIVAPLGEQEVEFEFTDREEGRLHVVRLERYFLMEPGDAPPRASEPEFVPAWMDAEEALHTLTFEAEREWVRRALRAAEERNDAPAPREPGAGPGRDGAAP